jgi:glycosyltransferase involved in cell wall biosynthesis
MENRTIAVLLPVYGKDKEKYLTLSVNSILSQTYSDLVLYIGVDGPVNDSLSELIKSFEKNDDRVKPIWFTENRGLAIVLNDLIKFADKSHASFIARMDADDISLPERFEKQIAFLDSNPQIDVVGGAISEIDEDGNSRNKVITYPSSPNECRTFFAKRNPHAHPAVMFRSSFFRKIGHGYRPEYRQNQDTMLWLDGFANNTLNANIPDIVLNFRMTEALFKKRRNGWKFAKKQFKDRLYINKTLGYGIGADAFGLAMFVLQLSPTCVRKVAYKIFR